MIISLIFIGIIWLAITVLLNDGISAALTYLIFMGLLGTVFSMLFLKINESVGGVELRRDDVKIPIYSIRNQGEANGRFILGSGFISSSEYYVAFVDNRGGLIRAKYPSYSTTVFQDSDEPYVMYQTVTYRASYWVAPFITYWKKDTSMDLHVPKDTIIEKFELR